MLTLSYIPLLSLRQYVTGPMKWDQVAQNITILQNYKYPVLCEQYLISVSFKMLPIKVFIDGRNFMSMALADS